MALDDLWISRKTKRRLKRYGRGKRWRVRWIDPETGSKREELYDNKEEAKAFDNLMQAAILQGTYVNPTAGKETVAEFSRRWRDAQLLSAPTAYKLEWAFRCHINPILGRLTLAQVRSTHIKSWVKDRSQKLAPNTVHYLYSALASMFKAAVLDRAGIGVTPCQDITLPEITTKSKQHKKFIPTSAQVTTLVGVVTALAPRLAAAVSLAAGCGLRMGEIMGLTVDDIDFLRRKIHVQRQLQVRDGVVQLVAPKTATSIRTVDVPQRVIMKLSEHLAAGHTRTVTLPDATVNVKPGQPPAERAVELLFTTETGRPVTSNRWAKTWKAARDAVKGLPATFGMHGLRHFCASLLIYQGINAEDLREHLGHSSATITWQTYVHLWPEDTHRVRDMLDAAFEAMEEAA